MKVLLKFENKSVSFDNTFYLTTCNVSKYCFVIIKEGFYYTFNSIFHIVTGVRSNVFFFATAIIVFLIAKTVLILHLK